MAGKSAKSEISITQLAQRIGVSRKCVSAHIERGTVPASCIEVGPNGRVIVDAARAEAAIREALARKPVEAPSSPVKVDDPDTWVGDPKRAREFWAARQAKLKAELASGDVVRAGDVKRELFAAARVVRDQLLRVPERAAHDVAAELGLDDAEPVRRIMQAAVERGLAELAAALKIEATP